MNERTRRFARQYAAGLRRYLTEPQERLLQRAYELGRKAVAQGLGVLDMVRIHQTAVATCSSRSKEALIKSSAPPPANMELPYVGCYGGQAGHRINSAESFLLEALSPFEVTHRGFREANLQLRQLNAKLEQRNTDLAAMNRRLEQAGRHYRQLLQQARRLQQDLRVLSSQILHVQEEERTRLSRELHDQVGQCLTAINMNLGMLQHRSSNGSISKQKIADSLGLLQQTMETVHDFARELRPAMLDELGLLPALRSHVKCFGARAGLKVRLRSHAGVEQLSNEQKTVLYRVAQESLTNVAKHARASRVGVNLYRLRHAVQMQIKDNGRAFEVQRQLSAAARRRLGLLGMQERVRLINGRFDIRSAPGKGTTVLVEVPFKRFERRLKHNDKNYSIAG